MTYTISGYFPEVRNEVMFTTNTIFNHPSHTVNDGDTTSVRQKTKSILNPIVATAIANAKSNYITGMPPSWHYGPFGCVIEGVPPPDLPDKFFYVDQIKFKNLDFKKRVSKDEIIMSPYRTGMIHAKYVRGAVDIIPPREGRYVLHNDTDCSLFEIEKYRGLDLLRIGNLDFNATSHYVPSKYRKINPGVTPWEVGWDDSILTKLIAQLPSGPNSDVTSMITNVTSEANQGTLDALTAVAEMPETVREIMKLVSDCVHLYKDARKKEIWLYNKVKRIQGLDNSQMSAINRAKAIKDTMDAIADVWLTFRYGIMPNVYLIQDIVKTSESLGTEFLRFRGRTQTKMKVDNINLPSDWTTDWNIPLDGRVCIKRSYSTGGAELKDLLGANLFVTAWELVPLSFVVDWFINIGDALGALISPTPKWNQGATFSWKISNTPLIFTHKPTGAQVVVNINYYDRAVINPSDYCRLVMDVNVNWKRQLDAFALSWKILIGNLHRK